jgi:hypothetical protein
MLAAKAKGRSSHALEEGSAKGPGLSAFTLDMR